MTGRPADEGPLATIDGSDRARHCHAAGTNKQRDTDVHEIDVEPAQKVGTFANEAGALLAQGQ